MWPGEYIERLVEPFLGGDDPVFGWLSDLTLPQFFDLDSVAAVRRRVQEVTAGLVLVVGCAESERSVCDADVLVYADLARWEAQNRFRRNEASNLGVANATLSAGLQYKRAYFVDWRVCDRWKRPLIANGTSCLTPTIRGSRNWPRVRPCAADCGRGDAALSCRAVFRSGPLGRPVDEGSLRPGPRGRQLRLVLRLRARREQPVAGAGRCAAGNCRRWTWCSTSRGPCWATRYTPDSATSSPFASISWTRCSGGNLSFQVHPLTDYIQQNFGMTVYARRELLPAGRSCGRLRLSRPARGDRSGPHGSRPQGRARTADRHLTPTPMPTAGRPKSTITS